MASDMIEHLNTLQKYASMCGSVVELGVRWADETGSTMALLRGVNDWMVSIDNQPIDYERWQVLRGLALERGVVWKFFMRDSREPLPPRDLLFIDTLHTYDQLSAELRVHEAATTRFIILHDTETFGQRGEDGTLPGLQMAVDEFLAEHEDWDVREHFTNCNGLTILERRNYVVLPDVSAP